jgi:hypothetical protein
MEALSVCGVTNDGKLWLLGPPWLDVKALSGSDPGPFRKIASTHSPGMLREGLHICGITQEGRLWHTIGLDKWEPFEDVSSRIGGDWGALQDVGVATVNDELHVCVTAPALFGGWRILHTIRHEDGTWDIFEDVTAPGLAGFPGSFISVACAAVGQELHLCAVTDDGRLWHTVRSSQNVWQPFKKVETRFAHDPLPFEDVSITQYGTLQIFAQAGGDIWHTARVLLPPGWQPVFDSLKAQTRDDPGSFVSVSCVTVDDTYGQLAVYGTTDDGKVWDTVRFLEPPFWFSFEDVAAEVASPGFFIDVSIANLRTPQAGPVPTKCKKCRSEIIQDCNNVEHASNATERNYWKGRIHQLLQNWPANCSEPHLPPDCL